jgi:membrane protein DedA with SNARE-associated domain
MEQFLTQYGPIGVFLGAAFEGQTAVVVGGLLARQHLLPLWVVLACATAGSGILDHLLFVAGRRFRSHRLVMRVAQQKAFARALRFIERYPVSYILAFRFILGLRMASPIAIGVSEMPTWRFTVLNIAGAVIWAAAFTALGYMFGETVHNVFGRHAGRWTLIIAGGLVAAVLVFALVRHLRKKASD